MRGLVDIAQRLKRRYSRLHIDPTKHTAEQYYGRIYLEHIRRVLSGVGQPPLRILDVGCGAGRFMLPLARDGHRITGLEYHRDSARLAREHLAAEGLTAEVIEADARDYLRSAARNPFDAVLALEMLYVNPGPAEMLGLLARAVRPGGLLLAAHRTRFYYLASALAGGHLDDAELIVSANEGELRKGSHRVYYNWFSPREIPVLYERSGLTLRDIHAIGPYSGFEPDPLARLCDPSGLDDRQREILQKIETHPAHRQESLVTARYLFTISSPDR